MNVNVQSHHVFLPSHAGTELARRAAGTLRRFGGSVARLHLTLRDINGPRGGVDKECLLRAELVGGVQVIVIDRKSSLRQAIGGALQRAKLLIAGELARRGTRGRRKARQRKHGVVPETTLEA